METIKQNLARASAVVEIVDGVQCRVHDGHYYGFALMAVAPSRIPCEPQWNIAAMFAADPRDK